jgi:hypothetical protein
MGLSWVVRGDGVDEVVVEDGPEGSSRASADDRSNGNDVTRSRHKNMVPRSGDHGVARMASGSVCNRVVVRRRLKFGLHE